MSDTLSVGSFHIFCQNVNRNNLLLESILALSIDDFDIIFIQEPPWRLIRHAPLGANSEGEPVIGTAIHPDWGLLVHKSDLRNDGADNPQVAVYVHKRLKGLRPGYRRDLIDHRDILVFSLGWGEDLKLLANVYSDDQHTAIRLLYEQTIDWPQLFFMGGDFNCRHRSWDPRGPVSNVHADRLEAAASRLGLARGTPVVEGPTHFPYNPLLEPTVIDLVYVPEELSLRVHHSIRPDIGGSSDHAPLLTELLTPGFEVNKFKSYLKLDTPEYSSWMKDVSAVLAALGDGPPPSSPKEIDGVVQAMSTAFSKAWDTHADFVEVTRNSKKWWNGTCARTLATYRSSQLQEDWSEFRRTTCEAKRTFFDRRIQDIANKKARP